jgi:hypothetical protein
VDSSPSAVTHTLAVTATFWKYRLFSGCPDASVCGTMAETPMSWISLCETDIP